MAGAPEAVWPGHAGRLAAAAAPAAPPTGSTDVACAYLPGGGARVRWDVEARRFAGHDLAVVSPAFVLDLPGLGPMPFKVVVNAGASRSGPDRANFRTSKGRGQVELKCDGPTEELMREHAIAHDRGGGARRVADAASAGARPQSIKPGRSDPDEQRHATGPQHTLPEMACGDRVAGADSVGASADEATPPGRVGAPHFHISCGVGPGGGAAGREAPPMRGPVLHSFRWRRCCGLQGAGEVFDLPAAVDKASRRVAIHIDVLPMGLA